MEKIAIISTRLTGIDGVSIEANKWAKACDALKLEPVLIAGKFEKTSRRQSHTIKEMDYYHPEIKEIRSLAFNNGKNTGKRDRLKLRKNINTAKNVIKRKLTHILDKNGIEYLSIENALSIPLNIPLGIALSEIISERKIKAITRHHDFYWERKEFLENCIQDILDEYFPPDIERLEHVVINTIAKKSLYFKKGIKAHYIPNVFDFKNLDSCSKNYENLRSSLNVGESDYLFLQPTRIIQRKKIERSIELVEKLSKKLKGKIYLFITGKVEKDEVNYFYKIKKLSEEKKINLILSKGPAVGENDILAKDVFKLYNIYDVYRSCDTVTLPSDIEGFGNPVIEACAFRKPLFVNNYPVLADMLEKGFNFIVINKKVDDDCVEKVHKILTDHGYRSKVVEKNYEIAKKFYSMESLVERLREVLYSM